MFLEPKRESATLRTLIQVSRNSGTTDLDGLIVTGAEPRTANLMDEPYWESLARVLEWARDHTHSTVFSCLAAHAAVLQMDGIGRSKSDDKHFGVFECGRVSHHRLMAGTPSRFTLPHSRWNGISEDELAANGYSVLTRSRGCGVDIFIKQFKSLFVFFQGHPEYEADTLLREYRRDVGRYLRGETETYPSLPRSYFDEDTAQALTALRSASNPPAQRRTTHLCVDYARAWNDQQYLALDSCVVSIETGCNTSATRRKQQRLETGYTVAAPPEVDALMLRPELTQIEGIA